MIITDLMPGEQRNGSLDLLPSLDLMARKDFMFVHPQNCILELKGGLGLSVVRRQQNRIVDSMTSLHFMTIQQQNGSPKLLDRLDLMNHQG